MKRLRISEEQVKNIFRIAVQIKTRDTSGETGSGLGLILCKEFVEKNEGSKAIISKLNVGSNFIVSLPSNYQTLAKC